MMRVFLVGIASWIFVLGEDDLRADEPPKSLPAAKSTPATPLANTVEQVAESARKSVVVIRVKGRDGKEQGLGTGFVVAADGLIATNLHVIGEARPITVQLADGKRHDVTTVEASDRGLDLALIRIDAKGLVPLEMGDSSTLKQGQAVVAVGNPHGLEWSVVSGVVSGQREIDGRPMIQLAIPLERGNSGGPLLDLQGRVRGIITMKSLVTANLGFAVTANSLKPLLQKPNPIPMARWLTIGALDDREWEPLFGGRWRQRGGRITVDGLGSGFGGRTLCLSKQPVPGIPFEAAVTVRLDDESGAAGLVFHADGKDKHYGFYPSSGQLRLTRFEGPDVYSWKILHQQPSPHYRPGEWNTLKVRIEKDKIRCFVNGQPVCESADTALTEGRIGLAKFRETQAEFKNFQAAKRLGGAEPPAAEMSRITKALEGLQPTEAPGPRIVETLAPESASVLMLRDRAKQLETQAAQLRHLAQAVHQRQVQAELVKALQAKEQDIDLVHAALLIARLDNEEVDVAAYRRQVNHLAQEVATTLRKDMDDPAKLDALNRFLFTDQGFHASRSDYYNRANSYLNDVLDDREGLPITLSVLYLELARKLGLNVVGVGLPGHFVVKYVPAKGEPRLIDVFEGGKALSREEADRKVRASAGRALQEKDLAPVTKKAILTRMLNNLLRVAQESRNAEVMLRYLDTILAIAPEAAEERGARAVLRYQTGRHQESLADVDWLLEHHPEGLDLDRLREFRRMLLRPER
jgi:regulator of sirC expression with transglutaminase-like and TPR domain